MQKKTKEWREELKNNAKFKQFYNYVFDYLREEKKVLGTFYSIQRDILLIFSYGRSCNCMGYVRI